MFLWRAPNFHVPRLRYVSKNGQSDTITNILLLGGIDLPYLWHVPKLMEPTVAEVCVAVGCFGIAVSQPSRLVTRGQMPENKYSAAVFESFFGRQSRAPRGLYSGIYSHSVHVYNSC